MRHAIDQPARRHRTNALVIVGVDFVDFAPFEFCFLAGVIEGPVAQEMDGTENEVESVPIFFDPRAAGGRVDRIVIQLDPGANLHIGIGCPQAIDFAEINARVVAIVIGEGDVG